MNTALKTSAYSMNKKLQHLGFVLAAALLVVACEPDEDEDVILRDEYLGTWNVNETTGWNAPQFYTVQITEGNDENDILINGLYNISGTRVRASTDGYQLSIPQQSSENIQFSGSGQANADFDQLSISFFANDGSGVDSVDAILTR